MQNCQEELEEGNHFSDATWVVTLMAGKGRGTQHTQGPKEELEGRPMESQKGGPTIGHHLYLKSLERLTLTFTSQ